MKEKKIKELKEKFLEKINKKEKKVSVSFLLKETRQEIDLAKSLKKIKNKK